MPVSNPNKYITVVISPYYKCDALHCVGTGYARLDVLWVVCAGICGLQDWGKLFMPVDKRLWWKVKVFLVEWQ